MSYKTVARRPQRSARHTRNAKTRPKGRAIRVYGQWDNYRTNFDDFRELYLLGIQADV